MIVDIRKINQKAVWEDFLLQREQPPFLQSWNMGVVHEKLGDEIFRFGVYDDDKLVGVCFTVKVQAKRGVYMYAPYGPVFIEWKKEYVLTLLKFLINFSIKNKCSYVKISPFKQEKQGIEQLFYTEGFRDAPLHILGETMWILDIRQKPDVLLSNMKKNHRNLIRKAEKIGVKVRSGCTSDMIATFLRLHDQTKERHGFVPYPNEYFKEQLNAFKDDKQVVMYEASYDGQVLASAILMSYGDMVSYHHGASLKSNYPASYYLHWIAINDAIKMNKKYYNFWGIYNGTNKKHPFYGISHFKRGFGGEIMQLIHCKDKPLSYKYYVNYSLELWRKFRRGFYHE